VIRVERQRTRAGKTTVEGAYDITRLGRDRADASRRWEWIRSHGQIENRRPDVRDVTVNEDGRRVRSGSAPPVLSALRNTVSHLLEDVPAPSKAAARRRLAAHPNEAIDLIST
jgi:hypothetical protein